MFKLWYYRNYCIDYHQILHNDKDRQVLFVGGPNIHPPSNKSKIADGRHFEKPLNRDIPATVRRTVMKCEKGSIERLELFSFAKKTVWLTAAVLECRKTAQNFHELLNNAVGLLKYGSK